MPRRGADPIDSMVGRNIRIHRLKKNMSQDVLAGKLGLTFQQVQKYEKGTNRVGSGRLMRISRILGVPVTALFEGAEAGGNSAQNSMLDLIAEPQSMRLVQAFAEIGDAGVRTSLVQLIELIAGGRKRPAATRRT
jgi:transcriptional regulator with XRE-family HTH domain